MEQLKFKLDSFEGPLDLLLMLIHKNKVSIYDIPISLILDQYLAVMNEMKEADLEVSSEFLVLAATLLHIKSKMLLPKTEEEVDDGIDPREELVRRLAEYKKIKESLPYFKERENIGSYMFFKSPDAVEKPPAQLNTADLTGKSIIEAYRRAFQRLERKMPPPKHSFKGIVGHEKISIKTRVAGIWKMLRSKTHMIFKELFKESKTKGEAVASFLAILELIRIKKIRVEYSNDGDIANPDIYLADNSDLDMDIIEE